MYDKNCVVWAVAQFFQRTINTLGITFERSSANFEEK